jgi:predicted lipid-binding transport protein (Tim44 family)
MSQQRGPTAAAAAPAASRFGGFRSLLLGGLIGAGLASIFGMGAFASIMGFMLQMLLIGGLVYLGYLAFMFFRNRSGGSPSLATASAGASPRQQQPQNYRTAMGATGGGRQTLNIVAGDYETYERLLKEVQGAYARGDVNALAERTTPEMLSYFAHELQENTQKGVSNDLSEPKLLKGDLAEAWRETNAEYATVAMQYEMIDATVDKRSGRVISGSTTDPEVITEVWTFMRPVNGRANQWELTAIQQAA